MDLTPNEIILEKVDGRPQAPGTWNLAKGTEHTAILLVCPLCQTLLLIGHETHHISIENEQLTIVPSVWHRNNCTWHAVITKNTALGVPYAQHTNP